MFSVFEKYRWGRTWNKQVKKSSCLSSIEFERARSEFRAAIHNGSRLLPVDLDRYHTLCVDLIAPVNNAYQIRRHRKRNPNVSPASTYDMLVVSMGIWLQSQLGTDVFTIITGDDRLAIVASRAKSEKLGRPMREHLSAVAAELGLTYSKDLYPTVVNLRTATKTELRSRFPVLQW